VLIVLFLIALFLIALFLITSLIFGVAIFLTQDINIEGTEVMNLDRFEALTMKLIKDLSVPESALGTEGSPQSNALHWLANQDPSQLDVEDEFMIQRYALAVLFFATSGTPAFGYRAVPSSNWRYQDNWMTGKGYCSWYGVECIGDQTSFDGNADVFGLHLTSNDLVGYMEPEINVFKRLDSLDLSFNRLSGTIRIEVTEIQSLRSLSLYGNEFEGPVLEEFGRMINLRDLNLGKNSLTGEIPSALGEATNLRALSLEKNNLQGSIPSNLEYLKTLGE
jgi:hypothetical protein